MDISVFLAQAFALYYLIFAMAMLLRRKQLVIALDSLTLNPGTVLLMNIVTLIIGVLLVLSHNLWTNDWRVLITVVCWMAFIKGVTRMFCSTQLDKMMVLMHKKSFYYGFTLLALLLGIIFAYFGFYLYR